MIDGWEGRLNNYIERKRHRIFRWGSNDCVLFALKGIEKICKVNIVHLLPSWSNKKEAKQVIKSYGKDLNKAADTVLPTLGFVKAEIGFASRGDLIITESSLGPMFTICVGTRVIAPGKKGLEFLPIKGICWKYKGR